jgi:hypothetical protein
MRTVNAAARAQLSVSVVLAVTAAATASVALAVDPSRLTSLTPTLVLMVGGSVAMFTLGLRRIRGWARTRLAQMDEIARRLTAGH